MDALQKRTNSLWMLPWLPQGCSAKTDGILLHVIMVATWMLCQNGWSPSARYHGCHMHALRDPTEFVGTLSWLAHGCSAKNGRTLCGRYNGCHMDALQKRTNSLWTLSWLPHGCSVKADGILLHVIMVATWILCQNGRSPSARYHGCHMDALWDPTEFVWTFSGLAHGCSVGTDGLFVDVSRSEQTTEDSEKAEFPKGPHDVRNSEDVETPEPSRHRVKRLFTGGKYAPHSNYKEQAATSQASRARHGTQNREQVEKYAGANAIALTNAQKS